MRTRRLPEVVVSLLVGFAAIAVTASPAAAKEDWLPDELDEMPIVARAEAAFGLEVRNFSLVQTEKLSDRALWKASPDQLTEGWVPNADRSAYYFESLGYKLTCSSPPKFEVVDPQCSLFVWIRRDRRIFQPVATGSLGVILDVAWRDRTHLVVLYTSLTEIGVCEIDVVTHGVRHYRAQARQGVGGPKLSDLERTELLVEAYRCTEAKKGAGQGRER